MIMVPAIPAPSETRHAGRPDSSERAHWAAQRCVGALLEEALLFPKPGLVSPVDSGSHRDMDFALLKRSAMSLRDYFLKTFQLGFGNSTFEHLRKAGVDAESRMLDTTCGVNTHRGALFNLGLLSAAAGILDSRGLPQTPEALCNAVTSEWGTDILASGPPTGSPASHGLSVLRTYNLTGGARHEAANGFPHVQKLALPEFQRILATTGSRELASIQALFLLISRLTDTNLLWRGGLTGLKHAQSCAQGFLISDGVLSPDWRRRAIAIHADFVAKRLSPGGSADLLAATLFLHDSAG